MSLFRQPAWLSFHRQDKAAKSRSDASRRLPWLLLCLVMVIAALASLGHAQSQADERAGQYSVLVVDINGPITPATDSLLNDALYDAVDQDHDALLVVLDTPGGLVSSMRSMVAAMLNAQLPVFVWVGPRGARAASAGVFLVAASTIAGMSPQTTIGAASPVSMDGKDVGETMQSKIKNDLMSFVRGLAEARGRNADWYQRAVDDAVSITAAEAAMLGVVEMLADSPEDFLRQIASRGVDFGGARLSLAGRELRTVPYEPGVTHKLLSWLLDPQIAYLLLLGGMAGLFFEFTTPGAIFPGVFGGLCLLLALYALSVLPTTAAGILLILFAVVLFILEIFITSFGMLGLTALVSLFIGSLLLFRPTPGLGGVPVSTVVATSAGLALLMSWCLYVITRSQRSRKVHGLDALHGMTARVTDWTADGGRVFVRGESWKARAAFETQISETMSVRIVGHEGTTLLVEPEMQLSQGNPDQSIIDRNI